MSRFGWRRRWKATGTGLAQPNTKGEPSSTSMPGRTSVPNGSTWRTGLKLTRPSRRAVSSPSRSAIQACAASCSVIAVTTGSAQTESVWPMAARSIMRRRRPAASASCARRTSGSNGSIVARGQRPPRPRRAGRAASGQRRHGLQHGAAVRRSGPGSRGRDRSRPPARPAARSAGVAAERLHGEIVAEQQALDAEVAADGPGDHRGARSWPGARGSRAG